MVQSAKKRYRNNLSQFRRFLLAATRCITVKSLMRTMLIVIDEVIGEDSLQMFLAQHDNMIEALSAC